MKRPIAIVAAVLAASTVVANASWTLLALPDTTNWNTTSIGHLPDGRFIYGHNGALIQQDTFGAAAATAFTNAPSGDYAFVTASHVGIFNSGTRSYDGGTTSTSFTTRDTSIQGAYAGVSASGSLLMTGAASFGSPSGLFHISSSGTFATLVADFSPYSGGVAMNESGDVFIAYSDATGSGNDNNIYRYSNAQIAAAIAGTPLDFAAATFVGNLGVSGSLAYDPVENRLYAAGWQLGSGIAALDLDTNETYTHTLPGDGNYAVTTFSDGSNGYVGWVSRSGWMGGDTVTYGYDFASALPVPEPSTALLLTAALTSAMFRRNRCRA